MVWRASLGGAICGSLLGVLIGSVCGAVAGAFLGDLSLGLDGALLGGLLTAVAGSIYGGIVGRADQHPRTDARTAPSRATPLRPNAVEGPP